MDCGPWNSLEIAKLIAGLLVPITLAAFGVYVHRVTKRFEHLQWRSQKLVEKRLAVYDDLAPQLNELLCYFTFIGPWRDLNPADVVALKRTVDKKIHLAAPMFSKEFYAACLQFQELCFETYTDWGRDPLSRTPFHRRREARADWKPEWDECFSHDVSHAETIRSAYRHVMDVFARDIGVYDSYLVPNSGSPPVNIR